MTAAPQLFQSIGRRLRRIRRSKVGPALFSILMLSAVIWPIEENWRDAPRDDFPLSYYPMFSKKRGETTQITHVIGLDGHGNRTRISYRLAGTGGLNQIRKQLRKVTSDGNANRLCHEIAAKIAEDDHPHLAHVKRVAIVTGIYYLDDFKQAAVKPASLRIEGSARVKRDKKQTHVAKTR